MGKSEQKIAANRVHVFDPETQEIRKFSKGDVIPEPWASLVTNEKAYTTGDAPKGDQTENTTVEPGPTENSKITKTSLFKLSNEDLLNEIVARGGSLEDFEGQTKAQLVDAITAYDAQVNGDSPNIKGSEL